MDPGGMTTPDTEFRGVGGTGGGINMVMEFCGVGGTRAGILGNASSGSWAMELAGVKGGGFSITTGKSCSGRTAKLFWGVMVEGAGKSSIGICANELCGVFVGRG